MQLEERIDTLSKEARAHKTATESAQLLIKELREELQQVWIVYKVYLWPILPVVRVAEWSKAPDSRANLLPATRVRRLLVHVCGRGFESHL